MPEDNPETGVKVVSVVSPTPEAHAEDVKPPAESISVQPKHEIEGHVPYPRFKEVNEKAKSLEAELTKLRNEKLASKEVPSENDDGHEVDEVSKYERRLVEQGLDPKASKVLAMVMKDISKQEAKERYHKEQLRSEEKQKAAADEEKGRLAKSQEDISKWQAEFKKSHEDYDKLEPLMQKEWDNLDDGAKKALVASPKAFELLYKVVKGNSVDEARAEGEEAGRNEAYGTKSLKDAISSKPGTSANPGKKYTAEDVGKMSKAEYVANRDKVLSDLGLKK